MTLSWMAKSGLQMASLVQLWSETQSLFMYCQKWQRKGLFTFPMLVLSDAFPSR